MEYLTNPSNIKDIIFIYGSLFNVALQPILGPFHIASRVLMMVIVLTMISKTFFFLTIYPSLTPIVNMILTVFWDLKFLVLFYLIILFYFSLTSSVLGIGTSKELNPEIWDITNVTYYIEEVKKDNEYKDAGVTLGNFFEIFRVGVGDQGIIAHSKNYMGQGHNGFAEGLTFWILWFLSNGITAIVFMNVIVAEACKSYTRVLETLDSVV